MGTIRNISGFVTSKESDLLHDYYAVNSIDGMPLTLRKKTATKPKFWLYKSPFRLINIIKVKQKWNTLNWNRYKLMAS